MGSISEINLDSFLKNNLTKIVLVLFIIYFIIASLSVLSASRCEGIISHSCLFNKTAALNSDFYWNYNTMKYVATYGSFPKEVAEEAVGGVVMDVMWHSPLYYYLTAPIILLADMLNLSDVFLLTVFSIILALLNGFMFFLIIKHISKYLKNKLFILYALILFLFLPMHLFFTVAVNDDILFYFFALFSFYMYLRLMEEKTLKNAILFGVIAGLALFSKVTALLLLFSMFCYSGILQLKKRYKERTLILISFFVALLVGSYPLIRNYLLFGGFFSIGVVDRYPLNPLRVFRGLIRGYWGGVFGGLEGTDVFTALIALILMFMTLLGVFLYFKSKDFKLNFFILVGALNILMVLYYTCGILESIKAGTCMGWGFQNRYLILINPLIAIFSSIAFIKLKNKTLYILLFLLLSSVLFSLDFIFAFVS